MILSKKKKTISSWYFSYQNLATFLDFNMCSLPSVLCFIAISFYK